MDAILCSIRNPTFIWPSVLQMTYIVNGKINEKEEEKN